MRRGFFLAMLSILAIGTVLRAQDPKPNKSDKADKADKSDKSDKADKSEPERLFRSREPLEMTLRAPFGELFKDRDTLQAKPMLGSIEFVDEKKGPTKLAVTLETRGHFRLRRMTCSFAPLKVIFDREAAKGTVFAGQGSLKLGTHCQGAERYEQNLLVEESIYRMYNALTPMSHRTRLAKIRYVPETDTTKFTIKYGYFLEDDDEMAKRNAGKVLMQQGGHFGDMDEAQMDLVGLFEYMIGNTDWSVFAIHNIRILQLENNAMYYPVAYDFDFSGLVNAPYAGPDARLPIKSVRERLYRGPCRKLNQITPALELFTIKRDSMYAALKSSTALEPGRLKEATDYLDGFFNRIKNPKDFNDALGYACRDQ